MVTTSLLLGRPGSGKTTAFHYMNKLLASLATAEKPWSVTWLSDYDILYDWFRKDAEHHYFQPAAHGGFDVKDLTILDIALKKLEERVKQYSQHAHDYEIIMVEFARDDYQQALNNFSQDFLHTTHALLLDTHLEKCIERIEKRILNGISASNHFVSSHILRAYYGYNNKPYMLEEVKKYTPPAPEAQPRKVVHFIENNGTLDHFYEGVHNFVIKLVNYTEQASLSADPLIVPKSVAIPSVL